MWRALLGPSAAAALVLAAACAPHARAPVMDRSLVEETPDTYQVARHDTLYSIAWRYNLDYKALASANGIGPPYVIREGQRLSLTGRPVPQRGPEVVRRRPANVEPPPPRAVSAAKPVATPKPALPTPKTAASTAKPPAPTAAKTPVAKRPARPAPKPGELLAAVAPDGWRPPVADRPVRRFGGASNGFDYQLGPATRIHAASGGIVVYSGPGLGGFRHLVIVKASDRYLVAYGMNVAPELNEGETVLPGTVVARIESGGPTAGKFHFEIRDRGKPVDPGKLIRA
ncbi:MAG: peptidoglycan DD-metalloendopeptidase family protein [Gammaproteobacteria bacterium]|nr:peptidoglycan DD-metalloendopeptidase family protein [Gammaproteobacteria bacterium]